MKKGNKMLLIGFVLVVLTGMGICLIYSTANSEQAKITATGTIEVTTADITPKVSGYLSGLHIIEGDAVQDGQIIAKVERNDLKFQVAQAKSALKKAAYQLEDLKKGTRPQEIEQLRAKLKAAESSYVKAQSDFDRYGKLYQANAIAAQQFDTARASRDIAYNDVVALQQNLSLLEEGTRADQISAQQEEVERSQYVLETSEALLADTIVVAPLTGVIVSKNYENKEYVNPGAAIATVLDLNDCWVKIYVSSAQIGSIKVGQAADIFVDSFPGKIFPGKIREVGTAAEFTPHNTLTQNERAIQVFAVKVKINNSEGVLKPGMPADVAVRTNADRKEPL